MNTYVVEQQKEYKKKPDAKNSSNEMNQFHGTIFKNSFFESIFMENVHTDKKYLISRGFFIHTLLVLKFYEAELDFLRQGLHLNDLAIPLSSLR